VLAEAGIFYSRKRNRYLWRVYSKKFEVRKRNPDQARAWIIAGTPRVLTALLILWTRTVKLISIYTLSNPSLRKTPLFQAHPVIPSTVPIE
jgi:hypothetical protein